MLGQSQFYECCDKDRGVNLLLVLLSASLLKEDMKNSRIKVLPCKDGSPKTTRKCRDSAVCAEAEQRLHEVASHKGSVGPTPPGLNQARCLDLMCHVECMD